MKALTFAMSALAVVALAVSSGAALAVKASPPTLTCSGKCQACIEVERTDQGDRCVKCGVDAACMGGGDPGLSSDFTEMLNDHNTDRAQQCAAPLAWSAELAAAAQKWANACPSNGNGGFKHDGDRGNAGESLAWGQGLSATQAVKLWYDEVDQYDFNAPVWTSKNGHFTQLVWKNTTELGCAVAVCGGQNLWVCRYAPPGNFNVDVPGELAKNVGCGGQPAAKAKTTPQGGGGGGGGAPAEGGGGGGAPAGGGGGKLTTVSVVQTVEVYDAPGGDGNKIGDLTAPNEVQLLSPCEDSWCHVKGAAVPGGEGWVYDGEDYDSLQ